MTFFVFIVSAISWILNAITGANWWLFGDCYKSIGFIVDSISVLSFYGFKVSVFCCFYKPVGHYFLFTYHFQLPVAMAMHLSLALSCHLPFPMKGRKSTDIREELHVKAGRTYFACSNHFKYFWIPSICLIWRKKHLLIAIILVKIASSHSDK